MRILLIFILFCNINKPLSLYTIKYSSYPSVIVIDSAGIARNGDSFKIIGKNKVYFVTMDSNKYVVNFN